jgi:tetratricopeptide (TPR) repeat protein
MTTVRFRRLAIACGFAATTTVTVSAAQQPPDAAALRARGIELGFNLDYPEALAAFREATAAAPDDATGYRLAAATLWISLLFQQGAITVDDYLGQARANLPRPNPPADLAAAFRNDITRALTISERRLRQNPRDADARFQAGAAAAFRASYIATVEGRVLGGVGAARRAYAEHTRCLQLDPRRKDAGLVVGLYRYSIAALPPHLRLLARIAGFGSGRDSGLRLVEDAARHPSDVQTNARFTLILLYNREGRHDEALRIIRELRREYPRNRLLWLEEGSTALKAGRAAQALAALDEGLARLAEDPRPRATNEEARWHYYRDRALSALSSAASR